MASATAAVADADRHELVAGLHHMHLVIARTYRHKDKERWLRVYAELAEKWQRDLQFVDKCVNPDYERMIPLGQGAYGSVYADEPTDEFPTGRAHKVQIMANVLSKEMFSTRVATADVLARFDSQLAQLSKFCSNLKDMVAMAEEAIPGHIVPVLGCRQCMTEDGEYNAYVVMLRLHGVRLEDVYEMLSLSVREEVETSVIRILAKLNSAGIYHNDAAARNIMLTGRNYKPVLIDLDFLSTKFTGSRGLFASNDVEYFLASQVNRFGDTRLIQK